MGSYDDRPGIKEQPHSDRDVHFTCFVRLPFRRGDFVDPPLVEWDSYKDRELWKVLSNNPRSADIDWRALASNFDVSLPFILQQAAWLYERQLSQVRAQMRKVGRSNIPSPAMGHASFTGSHSMQRQTSAEGGSRMSGTGTSLTTRLSYGSPNPESSTPGTPRVKAPPISRNLSTTTVTQSRLVGQRSSRRLSSELNNEPQPSPHKSREQARNSSNSPVERSKKSPSPVSEDSSSTSSSRSGSGGPSLRASQTFRRTPRFMTGKRPLQRNAASEESVNDDNKEAESPAFLPFPNLPQADPNDLGATIRGGVQDRPHDDFRGNVVDRVAGTDSSTSSASSAAAIVSPDDIASNQRRPASFSPQQRAEIAQLNARRRAAKREGSDGTPSMGSSFSDLDDASVTQSALEEALLSNLGQGSSGASRISSISQALRSKYL